MSDVTVTNLDEITAPGPALVIRAVTRRRSGSRPRSAPRGEWFSRRRVSERRAQSARNRPLRRVWPVTSFFRVDPSTPVRVEISTAGGAPIALATLGDITE